jgi:hypothetical protein
MSMHLKENKLLPLNTIYLKVQLASLTGQHQLKDNLKLIWRMLGRAY